MINMINRGQQTCFTGCVLEISQFYLCFLTLIEHFYRHSLFFFGVYALSKLRSIVSYFMTLRRSSLVSVFFQDTPRDFKSTFALLTLRLPSWIKLLRMLSNIRAHDQRDEGSSEKGWFGSVKRLHNTFHPSQTNISGTFSEGPSSGEILVRQG